MSDRGMPTIEANRRRAGAANADFTRAAIARLFVSRRLTCFMVTTAQSPHAKVRGGRGRAPLLRGAGGANTTPSSLPLPLPRRSVHALEGMVGWYVAPIVPFFRCR